MKRRERIIGDLRLAAETAARNVDLPALGKPDQAGVRDELEAQPKRALLALLTGIGAARRAIGRGLEMGIAEAAIAALGEQRACPRR